MMSECWIGTEDISFGRRDRVVRAASGDGAMKLAPSAIMSGAQRERVGASRTDGEGHGEVSCLRAQSLVAPRAFANCKKDTYGDLLSTETSDSQITFGFNNNAVLDAMPELGIGRTVETEVTAGAPRYTPPPPRPRWSPPRATSVTSAIASTWVYRVRLL